MNLLISIVMGLILAALFVICLDVNRFVVRDYTIYSDKVDREYKIALLADMHNKEYGKDNYKLISAIKDMNPDMVCCAGDILTARPGKDTSIALKLFKYLKNYKVYYSLGNHEYRMKIYEDRYPGLYEDYAKKLKEDGVILLENDHAYFPNSNIRIQGLMIDREYYKRFDNVHMTGEYVDGLIKSGSNVDSYKNESGREDYCILLAHNPEFFGSYCESDADLIFAGHNHGGIVRLPLIGGLISPKLSLFPKYDGGLYNEGIKTMVLSRGLGSHTIPVRFFNPGELICVHLCPCKKD